MKFINQTIESFEDYEQGKTYSDIDFIKCHFVGSEFNGNNNLVRRNLARNIKFLNCKITGGNIGAGIVENVLIDGLSVGNHFQVRGTAFRHVVIRGKVDKLMITPYYDLFGIEAELAAGLQKANEEYYKNVDWALDISDAEFKDCDIRGVPADLIKRDPETQAIVRRDKVLDGKWKSLDLDDSGWWFSIDKILIEDGFQDVVLVASKLSKRFGHELEGINRLREAGIAEPD